MRKGRFIKCYEPGDRPYFYYKSKARNLDGLFWVLSSDLLPRFDITNSYSLILLSSEEKKNEEMQSKTQNTMKIY